MRLAYSSHVSQKCGHFEFHAAFKGPFSSHALNVVWSVVFDLRRPDVFSQGQVEARPDETSRASPR